VLVLEAADHACAALLEQAGPQTLASPPSAAEAIEVVGWLVRRLAVPASAGTYSLAEATHAWEDQWDQQVAAPDRLPMRAITRARHTIRELATDTTATMLCGDLHFRNILNSSRETG